VLKLSASRIDTFLSCSWIYHCRYILKLPDRSNDGAKMGTVSHIVLEMLLKKKHYKHYLKIINDKTCLNSPAILRLMKKHMVALDIDNDECLSKIDGFILCGLNSDFFMSRFNLIKGEQEFVVENKDPKYVICGKIDKIAIDDHGQIANIGDYKTSKQKFDKKKTNFNLQAYTYSLYAFKNFPNATKSVVDFLFLKFVKKPLVRIVLEKTNMPGFEFYLSYIYSLIENFSLESAHSNMAKYSYGNKWLCGKSPNELGKDGKTAFYCPYKFPFVYFALLNENGDVTYSSFDINDVQKKFKPGFSIKINNYSGCPAWKE